MEYCGRTSRLGVVQRESGRGLTPYRIGHIVGLKDRGCSTQAQQEPHDPVSVASEKCEQHGSVVVGAQHLTRIGVGDPAGARRQLQRSRAAERRQRRMRPGQGHATAEPGGSAATSNTSTDSIRSSRNMRTSSAR